MALDPLECIICSRHLSTDPYLVGGLWNIGYWGLFLPSPSSVQAKG